MLKGGYIYRIYGARTGTIMWYIVADAIFAVASLIGHLTNVTIRPAGYTAFFVYYF